MTPASNVAANDTDRPPVRSSWPQFDDAQIAAVVEVLRSGRVNAWTGPHVEAFEAAYAAALGRRHAIALSNGTAALEVALDALGIGPGDEVIVSPRSFFASAACVPFVGATPVFTDVDRDSQNLTPETIAAAITARTRAVLVVHHAGWPAQMDPIVALARRSGLAVIEDCAQAHGATLDGRPAGTFGDVAAFSFCQDKVISTGGEGGLVAMDDEALFRRAWSRKDHGKSYHLAKVAEHPPGFRWLHTSFGTNLRMTSAQAVLGSLQLADLPATTAARAANATALLAALARVPGLRVPLPPHGVTHAWYRAYVFVRPEALAPGWDRDRILTAIGEYGVPCFVGSCPEIYRESAFAKAGLAPAERLPAAVELGETSLAFQVDPTLGAADMARIADAVAATMARATPARPPSRRVARAETGGQAAWI